MVVPCPRVCYVRLLWVLALLGVVLRPGVFRPTAFRIACVLRVFCECDCDRECECELNANANANANASANANPNPSANACANANANANANADANISGCDSIGFLPSILVRCGVSSTCQLPSDRRSIGVR